MPAKRFSVNVPIGISLYDLTFNPTGGGVVLLFELVKRLVGITVDKTLTLQTVKSGLIVWAIKNAQTVSTKPVKPAFIQFLPSVVNFPEP